MAGELGSRKLYAQTQCEEVTNTLNLFYDDGLDEAWSQGWRWMRIGYNHMWYPPHFDDAMYQLMLAPMLRPHKVTGPGSITSANAVIVAIYIYKHFM